MIKKATLAILSLITLGQVFAQTNHTEYRMKF
jgi:hypothetical protein